MASKVMVPAEVLLNNQVLIATTEKRVTRQGTYRQRRIPAARF
jgi:hypothetical protein